MHAYGDLAKLRLNALSWKEKSCESRASMTYLFLWLQVDLSFSPSEGLPSSDAHLQFRASPNSLCAVRAVDKSVLLMKPEADLSPSSVRAWSVKQIRAWSEQEQPVLEWKQGAVPLVRAATEKLSYAASYLYPVGKKMRTGQQLVFRGFCDFKDGN